MFGSKEPECILAGPADTGKSWACCIKAHTICSHIPNAQGAMVRKTFASLSGSVVKTFQRIIKGSPVKSYGGESPSQFIYPNGSRIYLGGMDNSDRVLSSERDFIYACQAEELKLDDWEILLTRASGRGAAVENAQLFGDCNPGGSKHWIKERAKAGSLRLLKSLHKDNPSLYTIDGKLVDAQAARRMAVLDALTGVRRKRLRDGIWATSEGAVYENFDSEVHVRIRDANDMVKFMLAMDEGFTNPQVCLLIGADGDNRWHIFKEFYVIGYLETQIVGQAKGWFMDARSAGIGLLDVRPVRCQICAVDNAAPGLIAALVDAGVNAVGGKGALVDSAYNTARGQISGISKIQDRLAVQKDGKPRLTVDPSCVNTINEFESYVWKPGEDIPEDEYNHALGGLRYLEDVLSQPSGAFKSSEQFIPPTPGFERLEVDTERVTFDD